MPGTSTITRSLRTILNFTDKQVKVYHGQTWTLLSEIHYTDTALLSARHGTNPSGRALAPTHTIKAAPRTREHGNDRISCQLNLQCADDSCKPLAETKANFWEKELCRMERLGINKEPWNACPFQLAIETPSPGQEVGVYITTSLGGYFRLLALLM